MLARGLGDHRAVGADKESSYDDVGGALRSMAKTQGATNRTAVDGFVPLEATISACGTPSK